MELPLWLRVLDTLSLILLCFAFLFNVWVLFKALRLRKDMRKTTRDLEMLERKGEVMLIDDLSTIEALSHHRQMARILDQRIVVSILLLIFLVVLVWFTRFS